MSLSDFSTDELLRELGKRSIGKCLCGNRRKEYTEHVKGFFPRTGCLTCDTWDNKLILDGTPLT